ncbi:MAG: universal stress protein [Paracoccaceae bacterium]
MAFMTITTVITDIEADRASLDAAAQLAAQSGGHLDVLCLGIDQTQPGFYYSGTNAMAMQSNLVQAESDAEKSQAAVEKILEGANLNWAARPVFSQSAGLAQFLAYHTRFSDIVVLPKPYGESRGHEGEAIVESALFDAKVPVLIVPDAGDFSGRLERVVVAWNDSREALVAVRAALPVLIAASSVNVTIIDPPTHAPDRSDPGGALLQMLSRHGVHAEVSILAKTMPRVSDVIARHVGDQNADLLVMGAYGHSRFRESILGGATRNMLQMAKTPILMAH